jgi:hypothetical protein
MRSRAASLALTGVLALLGTLPAHAQNFTGTYQVSGGGTTVTLTLRQARNGQITGTLAGNATFQVRAQVQGAGFAGYASNDAGRIYLEGQLAGTQLQVAMAEVGPDGRPQAQTARTVAMERLAAGSGRAGQGGAMGNTTPGRGAPKDGGQGAVAASGQDRQIAQVLLRSPWCTMSYSGVAGSSSGTTRTERVVFRADGTGVRRSGGESYYSGEAGSVGSQSSGGAPFRWQVRGGVLNTSSDGVTWAQTPLRITTNSSGWPIITAEGKEYSMCN